MNPLTTAFENQLVEPSVARNIFESGFVLRDTAKGNVNGRARDMLAIFYTAKRSLDMSGLLAIAIDPCYISKAGKKTAPIGTSGRDVPVP